MKKFGLITCFLVLDWIKSLGQPGLGEMEQARGFLRGSFFSMRDLSFVLAAIIALCGSLQVYSKWQSGKDVSTDLPAWFLAALFVILTGAFITAAFGI